MARETQTVPMTAQIETTIGDVALLLDRGRDSAVAAPVTNPDGSITHFVGKDVRAVTVPALNPLLPDFVREAETMVEPASFSAYVTAYRSSTAICRASLGKNTIVAVLDYHGRAREAGDAAVPGRGEHVVTLLCPFDLDYARWRPVFAGTKTFDQDELAKFLEDMIHTIGNVTIAYQELDDDNVPGRDGKFTLPDHVDVVVPIFQGGTPVVLTAKLRHRMEKGVVAFSLIVPSIDVKEREAFRAIGDGVARNTGTPVFYVA